MEPKPLITYFGDVELLNVVLQKKLQSRLKQIQLKTPNKEDLPYSAFSSLCSGVEFVVLTELDKSPQPLYHQPALHTFWTSCADASRYRNHDTPLIEQWLSKCSTGKTECLIVYCITAEVRSKRARSKGSMEEKIRSDFKTKGTDVITFRLSASEDAILAESYNTFIAKINSMCLGKFNRNIDKGLEQVAIEEQKRSDPEHFYSSLFVKKLDLAVCCEMTLQSERALKLYTDAISNLEAALSMFVNSKEPPKWLTTICEAPCTSWDYPKLVWSQFSWRYLREVRECSSLLHIRTFFLGRVAHLLFQLERAWTVSELVISTLHCMAREIKMLKLSLPSGAFDCWAYMTCNEAVQAFMALISPDSLESAPSSLLLVRAEIWHYALQKLESIGILCGVMPSSNVLNHDRVLIEHITSGVHPLPTDSIPSDNLGIEDQGQKLIMILNERQGFHSEYLRLGEMVIGAFKYAGRRRMAFKVGTMIAQFQRDLGLFHEAEELLCDICKFYSEDQWTQLSTNAFSLLADCQMKLKLEDKYVNTMLLLSSLPPYPGAAHDPRKWLSNLTRIAQRSPYQKILNWDPLLQFRNVKIVDEKQLFTVGDFVSLQITLNYLGPTDLKSLIMSIELRDGSTPLTPSTPSTPPRHSILFTSTSPTHSISSLANMEDLDLSDIDRLPRSRPIGGEGKFRSSAQQPTLISAADIADIVESDCSGRGKSPVMLVKMGVHISPGENKIVVPGKISKLGEYHHQKISIKWGCLDFVYTVTALDPSLGITVQPTKVNVDVLVQPDLGVLLVGHTHDCHVTISVGENTVIPEDAIVRLDPGPSTACSLHNCDTVETSDGIGYRLPAMSCDQSHDCSMTLCVGAKEMKDSELQDNSQISWEHEVTVYCEWLSPVYSAKFPLAVYHPFSVTCREHSAGNNSFLQLILLNSCPLPLAIRDVRLETDLQLSPLHSNLPEVMHPCETLSFLWLVQPAAPRVGDVTGATFQLSYQPHLHDNQLPEYEGCTVFKYNFQLSNMQTIFEVCACIDPLKEQNILAVKRAATLSYKIKNVSTSAEGRLPQKLTYKIVPDPSKWVTQDSLQGQLDAPDIGETIEFSVQVSPSEVGAQAIPGLTLSAILMETIEGSEELTKKLFPLTEAQVCNTSYGDVVTIRHLKL